MSRDLKNRVPPSTSKPCSWIRLTPLSHERFDFPSSLVQSELSGRKTQFGRLQHGAAKSGRKKGHNAYGNERNDREANA